MTTGTTLEPTPGTGPGMPPGTPAVGRRGPRVTWSSDGGRVVVVKRAAGADRPRLRREAAVLRSLAGPELVQALDLREHDDHTDLVLSAVAGPTLAGILSEGTTGPAAELHVLALACETVARLHARGWAHGNLRAEHVLISPRGRVRLCSLSCAVPLDRGSTQAAADRAALLRMADRWTDGSPTGTTALFRRLHRTHMARRLRRRTARLVDDPDPLVLARIVRRVARRHRTGAIAVVPAVVAIVAVVAVALVAAAPWGAETGAGPATPARSHRTSAPPCADITSATPDLDGNGCGEPVTIDGSQVVVSGRRYRIGAPGDVIAIGDWDCDGTSTALVLRPLTGELFEFPAWARPGAPTSARLATVVPGARDVLPPTRACGDARITMQDGSRRTTGVDP